VLVVTIDGPAGVGKSTVACRVAERLGWARLDSGALYRAVALAALERGTALDDEGAVATLASGLVIAITREGRVLVDGMGDVTDRLRSPRVTAAVAVVAAHAAVRAVMVGHQRGFARREGRIVAEGRDMGTVVFPDAAVKTYLDATPAVRAGRRLAQDAVPGRTGEGREGPGLEAVQADLEARDRRDRSRAVAPLRPAGDAWRLDTSAMTLDEVVEAVLSHVRSGIPADAWPETPA
jgi:cytidylate kinase